MRVIPTPLVAAASCGERPPVLSRCRQLATTTSVANGFAIWSEDFRTPRAALLRRGLLSDLARRRLLDRRTLLHGDASRVYRGACDLPRDRGAGQGASGAQWPRLVPRPRARVRARRRRPRRADRGARGRAAGGSSRGQGSRVDRWHLADARGYAADESRASRTR